MNKPPLPLWFMETQLGRRSPRDCLFHVIPVMPALPGRRDARLTPQAVLETSQHLAIGQQQAILQEQGIFTQAPLDSLVNTEEMLYQISAAVARTVQLMKIPVLIGSDPMITLGALHALLEQKQAVSLAQVSPRARLKNDDDGTTPWVPIARHDAIWTWVIPLSRSVFAAYPRRITVSEKTRTPVISMPPPSRPSGGQPRFCCPISPKQSMSPWIWRSSHQPICRPQAARTQAVCPQTNCRTDWKTLFPVVRCWDLMWSGCHRDPTQAG